jgi:hypothetical protein
MALIRPNGIVTAHCVWFIIKQKALMHAELGDGEYYSITAYIPRA